MRVTDIVRELIAQGHTVELYWRPDGGQRITRIDGRYFSKTGAEGNNAGRKLLNAPLPKAERKQRELARRNITRPISKSEKSILRKINKRLKHAGQRPMSLRKARKQKKELGFKEYYRKVKRTLRHYQGYAYQANIDWAIEVFGSKDMSRTVAFLERHRNIIFDSSLYDAVTVAYKVPDTLTVEEGDRKALEILKSRIKRK